MEEENKMCEQIVPHQSRICNTFILIHFNANYNTFIIPFDDFSFPFSLIAWYIALLLHFRLDLHTVSDSIEIFLLTEYDTISLKESVLNIDIEILSIDFGDIWKQEQAENSRPVAVKQIEPRNFIKKLIFFIKLFQSY